MKSMEFRAHSSVIVALMLAVPAVLSSKKSASSNKRVTFICFDFMFEYIFVLISFN